MRLRFHDVLHQLDHVLTPDAITMIALFAFYLLLVIMIIASTPVARTSLLGIGGF